MTARPLPGIDRPASVTHELLLLATDATLTAESATRVAVAVAAARGSELQVVSVLLPELYPLPISDGGISIPLGEIAARGQLGQRLTDIERQLGADGLARMASTIHTEVGPPATVITREARRRGASLVVMGLRPHGAVDRLLRDETTLRVVRESPVPVLAVTPTLVGLPSQVAIAVDFSRASLRAARAALDVLAPDGTLHVVYVRPEIELTDETEGTSVIYSQGIAAALSRFRRELVVPPGVKVEAVMLQGEPASEILTFAGRADIDLIGVGSHRHPFLTRLLLGTVTSRLVRDGRFSLLVSPPMPARSAS
jgi:nucleotide-binding universal stress UspA family protein